MKPISLKTDEYGEGVCRVAIKAEAITKIYNRFLKECFDWHGTEVFLFGKCEPWGGFSDVWCVKDEKDHGVVEFNIDTERRFDGHFKGLENLDLRLEVLGWIKKHILPEEIMVA